VESDPAGLSSTTGQLISVVILLGTLVVLIRWWVHQRRR